MKIIGAIITKIRYNGNKLNGHLFSWPKMISKKSFWCKEEGEVYESKGIADVYRSGCPYT